MACKLSVEFGILDKVINDVFEGHLPISRISRDIIQVNNFVVNNKVKIFSRNEAVSLLKKRLAVLKEKYNDHVIYYQIGMNENRVFSVSDPLMVKLEVNPNFIEFEYSKLPYEERNDPNDPDRYLYKPSQKDFLKDDALFEQEDFNKEPVFLKTKEDLDEFNKSCSI